MPPEKFFAAYSACCNLLPPGMELDLVPLEDVHPEMWARILGEVKMPKDPISALKGLVEDELTALEWVVQGMDDPPPIHTRYPLLALRAGVSTPRSLLPS